MLSSLPPSYFFYEGLLILFLVSFIFMAVRIWYEKLSVIRKITIFAVLIFSCLVILYGCFIEPYKLVIRDFYIKDKALPSLKIGVISDIHVGPYRKSEYVARVVEKVNSIQDLDLVVMPGDFIFGEADPYIYEAKPLANLRNVRKFATLGNHDHDRFEPNNTLRSALVVKELTKMGIEVLTNNASYLEDKAIWIIGLDDNDGRFHDLSEAFSVVDDKPKILLTHSPDIMLELNDQYRPNLVISGHNHCGQIRLPFIGAVPLIIPSVTGKEYERHLYEYANGHIFVSCGLGETGTRARLFNPPEIDILHINE